ncbi:MAG TPA: universal stress protein [Edaphobacter sp.]|uniref:universal stress protein n=1 Tax=Edaphobacter sp. TaxID=1934404 RepID=UPI002BE89986|nr:universal stress protein [Edaphobacter sp.]HUZ96705.1 universal stress protein [Edaphobacter sp.]
MTFNRILIAIDESTFAAHAADVGTDLATQLGAEVAFVTVVDSAAMPNTADSGVPAAEWLAMLRHDAKTLLGTFASRRAIAPPPLQFLEEGKPATKIVDAARNWPADLIVMGTHGRNAVANVLLGSVAQGVLRHAPCAVMVLRAQ